MLAITQKTCLRCGDVKDATEFHRDRSKRDGLVPYCKSAMEFLAWRVAIAC